MTTLEIKLWKENPLGAFTSTSIGTLLFVLQVVFKSLRDGADQVALAHVKVTASNSSCDVDPPEADTERTVPKVMPPTCECSMDSKTGSLLVFEN